MARFAPDAPAPIPTNKVDYNFGSGLSLPRGIENGHNAQLAPESPNRLLSSVYPWLITVGTEPEFRIDAK
jgi:hypothetical protein